MPSRFSTSADIAACRVRAAREAFGTTQDLPPPDLGRDAECETAEVSQLVLGMLRASRNDNELPILVPEGFRIVAHRGASAHAPENTLAAFRHAARMGVREVELDVRFSKDRHLIICHDPMLDRYGHSGCAVSDMTLRELKSLDVGTWFAPAFRAERLLTLGELFDQFGSRFVYHVEIKEPAPGIEDAVIDALSSHALVSSAFVRSFHYAILAATRSLNPEIRTG